MVLSKKSSKFVLSAILKSTSAKSHSPLIFIFSVPRFGFSHRFFKEISPPLPNNLEIWEGGGGENYERSYVLELKLCDYQSKQSAKLNSIQIHPEHF